MAVFEKTVVAYRCERCGHEWIPRKQPESEADYPTVCPKCKSPYWNKPRKTKLLPQTNLLHPSIDQLICSPRRT